MAAIAMAESSGDSNALNPTDNGGRQTSWGLWQISDGTHGEPVPDILDPVVNARAAMAKLQTQGLTAWGTYDSGAWRAFYDPNVTPIPWLPLPSPPPPAPPKKGKQMIASTTTGKGYWCVTHDGAVYAFGDAQYHGAPFGQPYLQPGVQIVGIAGDSNSGYWLYASDGSVFAYGTAVFEGRPDRF